MKVNSNEMLPEGYKMTELGALPEEWELVRLGKATKTIKGRKPNYLSQSLQEKSIPYLTAEYFRTGIPSRFVLKEGNDFIEVGKDEIVFIWDGSNAGDVFIGLDGALASTMIKIIPDNFIYPKFLYYFLKTTYDFLNAKTTGSTIPHINKNLFNNLSFPLPPLPEQQKIAAVLSAVQEAKEKTQAVIDATKALKKSMMKHLFTYGPVPLEVTENVPLKETEIGKVPEEWEVVKFGEVTEKTKQKDPRRDSNTEFKYVDVSAISNDALKITSYSEFLGKDAPHRARKAIQTDDIIFTTVRPYLKRIAIVPENLNGQIASTAFCVIRCKKQIVNPYYIFYTVGLDNFVNRVTENQRGSSYPAVTDKDILNQYIPLPPLPVQQKIASILSAIDDKIEAEENKKKAIEELFKTILHNLMTAKIRVNHLEINV